MTPSTTNTAAREVVDLFVEQMDMLVDDYVRYQEGDKNVPFVVVRDALVSALNEYDKARPHILTQQQGGEQEAGGGVTDDMVERACEAYLAEAKRQNFNPSEVWARSQQAKDWMRAALTAALRTKQPAASEGDDGDGVANCAECGAFLESVRPGKHQHPTCSQANTSKQAAGEAVATVCLRGDTYAHGLFTELQVQHKEGVTFPIGTKFYLAPRHPADDGRDADSYYAEKAREQQDMIVLDKYADIARALGFPCDTWFGDPLASHEAIVSHATKLAALAGREAGEAASA